MEAKDCFQKGSKMEESSLEGNPGPGMGELELLPVFGERKGNSESRPVVQLCPQLKKKERRKESKRLGPWLKC